MAEINPLNRGNVNSNPSQKSSVSAKQTKESLFTKLDKDKNGMISTRELYEAGYRGSDLTAMQDAIFKAERNVNKWMRIDADRNGLTDNIEQAMWDNHNENGGHLDGDLTAEEFAKKYNLKKSPEYEGMNFEEWCRHWIEDENPMVGIKEGVKKQFGKDLTEEETQLLYDAMKMQANRWLFKENSLYGRLNLDAYTRLATPEQADSCCGGDISKPPMADKNSCALVFPALIKEGDTNSEEQVKNRLAWAAFKALPQEEVDAMPQFLYRKYQEDWHEMRNMTAADFRALLKPENSAAREKFEQTSNMTVRQITDYIDIVEHATGKSFDGNDWSIDTETFHDKIMDELNGTGEDDTLLEDKTRADIAPEKQEWLKYLEEHGMLLEQFKD